MCILEAQTNFNRTAIYPQTELTEAGRERANMLGFLVVLVCFIFAEMCLAQAELLRPRLFNPAML